MGRRYLKPRNVKEFDKEWIDEINRCLAERDRLLDQLIAEPAIFAWAFVATSGTGAITEFAAYGCRTEIAGQTIRLVFDTRRPTIDYVSGAIYVGGQARWGTVPGRGGGSQTETFVDTRFYAHDGSVVNATTFAFTAMIWAMGPRVLT